MLTVFALAFISATLLFSVSCVKHSGGTWMIKSAPLPAGWPELTPVGTVEVRQYPQYRAATVTAGNVRLADDRRIEPMFMTLFGHIQENEISMTAPVEMEYGHSPKDENDMSSMAFLYRTTNVGHVGNAGPISVRDLEPRAFASVGVRGDYTAKNFRKGLEIVNRWLADNDVMWSPAGMPRYLGYNGPFTPVFMRYGEVQIPIQSTAEFGDSNEAARTR
jgi:hypothetical protein